MEFIGVERPPTKQSSDESQVGEYRLESKPADAEPSENTAKIPEHKENEIDPAITAYEMAKSAKREVVRLCADGQQQIAGVEEEIDLSPEDISDVRNKFEVSARLKKISQASAFALGVLKERLSRLLTREKDIDADVDESAGRTKYTEIREFLSQELNEISRPMVEEAREKRNQLLEARGILCMSKSDFNDYFSSKEFEVNSDLRQQNVGDCYLVAAIYALSRSPHFETICRASMQKLPDGSWQVRIPLMSENGEVIIVTQKELLAQKNSQFLSRSETGGVLPDFRRKLQPMKGKEGLRVLEAAFIKHKFGMVDRLRAEGGFGDEVLEAFGGSSFSQYRIESSTVNPKGGKREYPGLSSIDNEHMAYLDHFLENFDPEIHIGTAETKFATNAVSESVGYYRIKGTVRPLVHGHSYSISNVDSEKRIITLANPWDTSKPIPLTFNQFKQNFSSLSAVRIDCADLLRSMTQTLEAKVA